MRSKINNRNWKNDDRGGEVRSEFGESEVEGCIVKWVRKTHNTGYYSKHTSGYNILEIIRADGTMIDCSSWSLHMPRFGAQLAAGGRKQEMLDWAFGAIRCDRMTPAERKAFYEDFPLF